MGKTFTWFDTSQEDRSEWQKLCPAGEYRIVSPNSVPAVIPRGLLNKADSVLVVASGSAEGQILYMVNIHRADTRALAIDQEPFGIIFHGNSPASAGCLLHHGNWQDRTTKPPPQFWIALHSSSIGLCLPLVTLPNTPAGPITQLNNPSQHDAFTALVAKMKEGLES
jgi:hypothetical protein